MGSSIRIGRIAGIQIGLHASWFVIFFIVAYLFAAGTLRQYHWEEPLYWLVGATISFLFFASVLAEVNMQPGPIRDRLVAFLNDWLGRLETAAREAQAEGAIDPREDAGQLAFEIEAALLLANAQFVIARTPEPIQRARRSIDRRLAAAAGTGRGTGSRPLPPP